MLSNIIKKLSPSAASIPVPPGMETKSVCVFQGKWDKEAGRAIELPLVVRQAPTPASADGTSEARPAERPFSPSEDVLYVKADDFRYFTQFGLKAGSWASELTHLAIPLSQFQQGLLLPLSFRFMPKLQTLSFVFPKSSGQMDIHAAVKINRRQEAELLLRKLTEEEGNTIKLVADYSREDPIGVHRVKYDTTAKEHVERSFEYIEQSTASNDPVHMPPYCDKQSRKLRLQYDLACFVGS
jgi:hypothetical protein